MKTPPEIAVGMGEMKIGKSPDRLISYALGSCLGVSIWDPETKVGGLLHVMVPNSTVAPEKAAQQPFMFVDTGVPLFFRACYQAGAEKARMIVKIAGGANPQGVSGAPDYFRIGERNLAILKKLLWKNNVLIRAADVGGHTSRTMIMDLKTGVIQIKTPTSTLEL